MVKKHDHLSTEVSISAKLEDKAVSLNAKSRFVSAVDRLLGSVADIPSSYFEGIAERIRLKNSHVIKQLIDAEENRDQLLVEVIAMSAHQKEADSLRNKRAVVEIALEHLESEADSSAAEIEEEWLNSFEKYSSFATTNRLRDIWGRVLAGEVHTPGNFSLMTLRFISELDSQVAAVFEKATQIRSNEGALLSPKELSGQLFSDLNLLQEVGLLQHVGGFAHTKVTCLPDGFFYLIEVDFALRVKTSSPQSELQLPIIFITRVGKEICSILPTRDEIAYLKEVAFHFEHQLESIDILRIVSRLPSGDVQLMPYLKIK